MILSKKFLVSLIFLHTLFLLYTQDEIIVENKTEFYRSNSNGLSLVLVDEKDTNDYKFFLRIEYREGKMTEKTLYKENKEFKKWQFIYNDNYISQESYYKEEKLLQKYFYNNLNHKIREEEFKNEKMIKSSVYKYNDEGLVNLETVTNLISNQITIIKYRYDNLFRIKQIEKIYPDGRVVYWESFLSPKGIIIKEYYTLKGEIYTFWYSQTGQEISGEIKEKNETEKIKVSWENFYTKRGLREKKIENNFDLNKKTITLFNKDGKETKIETYSDDELLTIEYYDYDSEKRITYYKIIKDLNINEVFYKYNDNDEIINTRILENEKLVKQINKNEDGSREETIYTKNNIKILIKYNRDGVIIFEGEVK